jgi:hypothetical protein
MTTLNITAVTNGAGEVRVPVLSTGIPNAKVQLTLDVEMPEDREQWQQKLSAVLGRVGSDSLMRFPSGYMKDPWEEED